MRLKIIFTAIVFIPLFVYSQDITKDEATVRVHYFFLQREIPGGKPFRSDIMTLDIGSQMSYYYDEMRALKDSLFDRKFPPAAAIKSITVLKNREGALDNFIGNKFETNYLDGTSEKIYKNRMTGQLIVTDHHHSAGYCRCDDPVGTLSWEITSDTATIMNYECQKAKLSFRGRDYEAWFAPEIPVNDGPWKFMGLPGLILKVNDTKGLIAFDCMGLQNLETPVPIEIPDRKYLKCNRKEMARLMKDKGAGMIMGINGGDVTIVSKALSATFQFLELE